MNKINNIIIGSLLLFIALSCNQSPKEFPKVNIDHNSNYAVLADTIITDVVIKNRDNDEWTSYTLRNLEKEQLVDELFNLVYSGELVPYNFFSETPITIDEVKEIERSEDYSRDKIGKVQFEEAWYFDVDSKKMVKKVQSIMLAYELYDLEGKVKGYKPVFKVYLNE